MKPTSKSRRHFLKTACALSVTPAVFSTFSALAPSVSEAEEPNNTLQIGLACIDITPPLSFPMAGYYNVRLSTGTSDPLLAKALCFQQNSASGTQDKPCVLLICDTISINSGVTTEIRNRIHVQTGIPRENILITATHTHTGPGRDVFDPNLTHEKNTELAKTGDYKAFRYANWWAEKGTEVILTALKNMRPATISVGSASVTGLSFNRRFFMKDSDEVRFNPGVLNPNIIRPAGPIDPQLLTVFFADPENGKPLASLSNFALHLDTTGGTLFSADYPYYIESVLKQKFGSEFVSLFGTGTCGDINHIDVTNKTRKKAPEIGTALGEEVAKIYDSARSANVAKLGISTTQFECRRQEFTLEEVAEAEKMRESIYDSSKGNYTFLERVRAGKILQLSKMPTTFTVDIQCIRLSSETAIVALPGEVFVDLGLEIKKRSPFRNTLVIELSQMDAKYVPTEKAFREGSYETINSLFVPETGERFVKEALACLEKLSK